MDEARLERTEYGMTAATEGWFTVNVRDSAWMTNDKFGQACVFEGDAVGFAQVGYTVHVLAPGQPNGLYHREDDQEDFLVLSGECIARVEDEERQLRQWDFLHCAAGTHHGFVGAGDGPCVLLMVGARTPDRVQDYPDQRSTSAAEAYVGLPQWQPGPRPEFPL